MNSVMSSKALSQTSSTPFVASVPGSKSYTNRALVIAAMRVGETEITNGLKCDDTYALSRALDEFQGLEVVETPDGFRVSRTAEKLGAPAEPLDMVAAGTPARLMLSFAALAEGETVVSGNKRLCERPMGDLLDTLRSIGIRCECLALDGCLPVRVTGGPVSTQEWTVRGDVSSQFTTSLLLYASQQQAEVRLTVEGNIVSRPYVDMTLDMMQKCEIPARREGDRQLVVTPCMPGTDRIEVETDASGMSYFLAAAAVTGTVVEIPGIGADSAQGDVGLARAFADMGCDATFTDSSIRLTGAPLKGIDIDMDTMPDVVLTLAAVAALAEGPTRITNIANLRLKECDRINAAARELERLGVRVEEGDDWITVHPSGALQPASIHTYDDHRVAMAFAVLGLVTDGIEIQDPACVAKSFPNFWEEFERFRAHHQRTAQ